MARLLDGDDVLRCSIGGLSGMTYGTFAVILRTSTTSGWRTPISLVSGGTDQTALQIDGTTLHWIGSAGDVSVSSGVTSTSTWYLLVARKATGTATPRRSVYDYTAGTWSHSNFGGTIGNGGSPSGGDVRFDFAGAGEEWEGDVAVRAAWSNTVRWSADATGDALLEASGLPFNLAAWHSQAPSALWVYDQSATTQNVLDLTGGGANQSSLTGTAVSTNSVPSFSYGSDLFEILEVTAGAAGATVSATTIAATATLSAPAVQTGQTVAATAIAATATLTAPALQTGQTVAATAIAATATLSAPTITAQTVTAPPTIAATATVGVPAVQTGSTVAATTVAASTTLAVPTLTMTTPVSSPTIAVTATVGVPAVQTGSTIAATTIAATVSVGVPVVGAVTAVSPATIAATATLTAPALQTGQTVAATSIAAVTTLGVPVIETAGNATVQPATIATVTTLPAPAVQQGQTVSATSIATVTTLPAPAVQTGSTVAVTSIATVTTLPAPSVSGSATVAATAIATVTTLPAPTVQIGSTVNPGVIATVTTLPLPTVSGNVVAGIVGNAYPPPNSSAGGAYPFQPGSIIGWAG